MPLDQTIEVLGHTNLKTTAEMPAWANAQRQADLSHHAGRNDRIAELAYSNQVALQARQQNLALDQDSMVRSINNMFLASAANKLAHMDPLEAISVSKAFHGEADSKIASLLTQLNSGGVATKSMALTPPETGVSSQAGNASVIAAMGQILAKIADRTPPKE